MSVVAQDQTDLKPATPPAPDPFGRWRRWFAVLLLAGTLAWALFAWGLMPSVVHSAYRQESFSFLNNLLDHRDVHPVEHYLRKWNMLAGGLLAAWVGMGVLLLATTSPRFAARCVGVATPGTLGALRMFLCLLCAFAAATENVHGVLRLPLTERHGMGVMDWVYPLGLSWIVTSATALTIMKLITVVALLLAAIGWKTRWMLVLGALLYIPLMGIVRSYTWFSHSGIAPLYLLLVLLFTPCGDGWSLDRLIRQWRGQPVPPADEPRPVYAWGRFAVWTVLCVFYLAAGLSKLRNGGWTWWSGVNMQDIIYTEALRGSYGDETLLRLSIWMPPWMFTAMGIGTLVIEIGMMLVLVSWLARQILPILAAGMHIGIQIFQRILFWDLILIQVIFYDWRAIRLWIARRIAARRGHIDVLYDGACPICRRTVRMLAELDLLQRLNCIDFRRLDLAEYSARQGVSISAVDLDRAMHTVRRGRALSGFAACRQVAGALPPLWPIVPLMYVPGLSHMGRAGYRWLAAHRMALSGCDDACPVPPAEEPSSPVDVPTAPPATWRRLIGPIVITGLILFYVGIWALRIEYYPFTSVQMFSKSDFTGVAHHVHVFQTDERGRVREAQLETMGRGIGRYRPVLEYAFADASGRGRQACEAMLQFCGDSWNRTAPPGQRVVKLEVIQFGWDFVQHHDDPRRGTPEATIAVEFDPPE